jgi:hypothetical protein
MGTLTGTQVGLVGLIWIPQAKNPLQIRILEAVKYLEKKHIVLLP